MQINPTRILVSVLAANVLVGCGAFQPVEQVAAQQSAIVNGSLHHGHPAVGMMLTGTSLCTVTLVGCKTVLSAAHCLYPSDASGNEISCSSSNKPADTSCDSRLGVLRYDKVQVVFGCSNLNNCSADKYFDSTVVYVHGDYSGGYPYANDLSLIKLDRAPPFRPLPIASIDPSKGMSITMVGYGITDYENSDSGIKRAGTSSLDGVSDSHFSHETAAGNNAAICSGDSGGPAFTTIGGKEMVLGVASYGYNDDDANGVTHCGAGYHARLNVAWLKSMAGGDLMVDNSDGSCAPADEQNANDTNPPTISIVTPLQGALMSQAIQVLVNLNDDVGLQQVALYADGASTALDLVPAGASGQYLLQASLQPGLHTLVVQATDASGNIASASVEVSIDGASTITDANTAVTTGEILGGCSLKEGPVAPFAPFVMLLGLLAWLRRPSRRLERQ